MGQSSGPLEAMGAYREAQLAHTRLAHVWL